jgi:hypothetical protein
MFCIVKGSIHPYLGTPIGNNLMLFQLEVLLDCFMVSSVFWYYNSSLIKSLVGNVKIRYFIVKSCNRENLEISVQQGIWATQRSNEAKLNEAFESIENVILIFSINRTRNFQGCAKMTSRIGGYIGGGNWKSAHGTAHYGRNFSIQWLKVHLSLYYCF